MNKYKLIVFLPIFLSINTHAQFWVQQGSSSTNNMAYATASDILGNTYTTGYFSSSIAFGGISLTASGPIDMFIVKTSSDGLILWAKSAGGTNVTQGISIAVNDTYIAVTGYFYGTANFDAQTITSFGQQDVFTAKYDLNGNVIWVKDAGGTDEEAGNKVAFDGSGNILVTGEFSSSNFLAGTMSLSASNNSLDVFTFKYDPSGNCVWAKSGSSPLIDRGTQITADAAGNVYVAGEFSDTVQFDQVHYNVMNNALFIIKYNAAGQEQWFRQLGSGSTVKMKGLALNGSGELIALGNYTSTLYYFGFLPASITLTNVYLNNFFISKISANGDLIWSTTDGSDAAVSSECLAVKTNNEIVVGGTYQCRFDDFSNHYGPGVFCSIGYNDCFVASYDNLGTWLWSRCFGGNKTDYLYGIATDDQDKVVTAGAFCKIIYFPENAANYLGYPNLIAGSNFIYCNDSDYYAIAQYTTLGNSNVYIGKPIDLSREVFDFFDRPAGNCQRDFPKFCINNCEDTVEVCDNAALIANTFTNVFYSPEFHYLWSTGDTTNQILVSTGGDYWVQITGYDSCWTDQDTIHVIIHPFPSVPPISDNKGINNNAINTQVINLCLPDSVLLTGAVPPGYTCGWNGFASGVNPVTITASSSYTFIVTDSFGCQNSNYVTVVLSSPLPPIVLELICLEDTVDRNDTIEICMNERFKMFVYDTLSNPLVDLTLCVPEENHIDWSCSDPLLSFSPTTDCASLINEFSNVTHDGWYTINAHLVRENNCAKDSFDLSKTIYIIVYPVPPDTLSIFVTGNTFICPGSSTTLYASSYGDIQWNGSGVIIDSCVFTVPGTYSVSASYDTTNSFGCTSHPFVNQQILITSDPLPQISVIPASALICPFDSVQLTCSGTGNFTWQGPNGIVNSNLSSIYVTTPGYYYCIRDDNLCILNSNSLEVFQYNTPLLVPSGLGVICNNQPVQMQVITGTGSIINWLPPLSGSSPTQTITQPGTYSCIVTACSINTPLSLTFPGSNPVAVISAAAFTVCQGDTVQLTSSYADHYLWSPTGDTTSTILVTMADVYQVKITDSLNCTDSTTAAVQFTPNFLQTPFANDTNICAGEYAVLIASGNSLINWLDENHSTIGTGPTLNTGQLFNDKYYLLYSDSGGCRSGYDSVNVFVEGCDTMTIPNVFTPGGDGLNDFFPGKTEKGRLYAIKIYNRWGKLVYESGESVSGWDGKNNSGQKLSDGTYYYILNVKFITDRIQSAKGWVELIREP